MVIRRECRTANPFYHELADAASAPLFRPHSMKAMRPLTQGAYRGQPALALPGGGYVGLGYYSMGSGPSTAVTQTIRALLQQPSGIRRSSDNSFWRFHG